MTETAASEQAAATSPVAPKKSKAISAAKKKTVPAAAKKPTHPPTAKMVVSAIAALKERGGSSNQAIKKYIASTYKIDAEKLAPFIKKYLKSAVVAGTLLQTKGKGASGSFKLAKVSSEAAPVKKLASMKAVSDQKTKATSDTKKPASMKAVALKAKKTAKTPTKAKKTIAKKASTVKKSPAKAKKAAVTKKSVKK